MAEQQHGYLWVTWFAGLTRNGERAWLCRCIQFRNSRECGELLAATTRELRAGNRFACDGCQRALLADERRRRRAQLER